MHLAGTTPPYEVDRRLGVHTSVVLTHTSTKVNYVAVPTCIYPVKSSCVISPNTCICTHSHAESCSGAIIIVTCSMGHITHFHN